MTARYTGVADWERLNVRRLAVGPITGAGGAADADATAVELSFVDHGEGPAVVLCHGFPELAFSWRHQVLPLAEAGFRVLIPDMRGYGGSSHPPGVEGYDAVTLAGDLVGLLDAAGLEQAVFVGHDWGASVVWHLALVHPDRVRAVAGLSVPVTRRAPAPPIPILRNRLGDDFYMVWFQEPGVADAALGADVRRALLSDDISARAWQPGSEEVLPARPFMTEEELDVFVQAFEATGFTGGLNYYRSMDRTWERMEPYAERKIDCPSMFLTGSEDLVAKFMRADRIGDVLTDLRENVVLDGAGHWVQQERPDEVNEALLRFLRSL